MIRGRKIHVNQLATESRKRSVKNMTIPKCRVKLIDGYNPEIERNGNGKWKTEKHKQPKRLRRAFKGYVWAYDKERGVNTLTFVKHKSEYRPTTPRPVPTKEDKIRITEELKIKKWEKRHPRPVPENDDQKDIFENQFVPEWEAMREKELQRIRDFVVSVYDKLKLTGRFKKSEDKFEEKQVAELKDNRQEGNNVNELDPKKSKLLKKAQKVTNKIAKKDKKLVCTNLKDHKGKKGRIILPKAA